MWETAEYGITVWSHTINGGKLYVLSSGQLVEPVISAEPGVLEFIDVYMDSLRSRPLKILNSGKGKLTVSGLEFDLEELTCDSELPVTVAGGDSVDLVITYKPVSAGSDEGTVTIINNSRENGRLEVPVMVNALPNAIHPIVKPPKDATLLSAYPNPFNSSTTITYTVTGTGWTTMDVLDINGRQWTKLMNGRQSAGSHTLVWSADNTPAGIYFIRLIDNLGRTEVKKVAIVK